MKPYLTSGPSSQFRMGDVCTGCVRSWELLRHWHRPGPSGFLRRGARGAATRLSRGGGMRCTRSLSDEVTQSAACRPQPRGQCPQSARRSAGLACAERAHRSPPARRTTRSSRPAAAALPVRPRLALRSGGCGRPRPAGGVGVGVCGVDDTGAANAASPLRPPAGARGHAAGARGHGSRGRRAGSRGGRVGSRGGRALRLKRPPQCFPSGRGPFSLPTAPSASAALPALRRQHLRRGPRGPGPAVHCGPGLPVWLLRVCVHLSLGGPSTCAHFQGHFG